MLTSDKVIRIILKDKLMLMLSLVVDPHPAFQAGRARLLILVRRHKLYRASEPMASYKHMEAKTGMTALDEPL